MAVLNFKRNDIWSYRDLKLRFDSRIGDGLLVFHVAHSLELFQLRDHDGVKHAPTEDWALEAFANGDLIRLADRRGPIVRQLAEKREYDAERILQLDPKAKMRAFVCRALDKLGVGGWSDAKLRNAINRLWVAHPEDVLGFDGKPSARSVRYWLKTRGEVGDRPLRQMLSMKGRVPRSKRFPDETLNILRRFALGYWAGPKRSMGDVYALMNAFMCRVNRMRKAIGSTELKIPSDETLRKEIRKTETFETYAARFGQKKAKARFRASGEGLHAERILELGCMDHTLLDTVTVLDAESGLPLGRPWLTVLIDVKSRCVVGFVISFENPSLYMATECVKRANRPKRHLRAGKERYRRFASIFGRFSEIVVDNGWELAGVAFEDAMADAGITVRWAPVKSPTYKAIVERFFGTLNTKLNHKLPGAALKPALLKELEIDPYKEAVLTLGELEALIWEAICLYHLDEHSGLRVPPGHVWELDVELHGIDVIGDDAQLDKMLGALKRNARLTRRGVEFDGLRYHKPGRVEQLLKDLIPRMPVRQRRGDSLSIPIKFKFNPADLGEIHVWNETTHSYVTLPCEDADYAKGLSLHQHQFLKRWSSQQGLKFSSLAERLEARAELVRKVRELCPDLQARERRSLRRLLQSPALRATQDDGVSLAIAEPRHDGLGPIVENSTLASERRDGSEPPRRPARGGRKRPAKKAPRSTSSGQQPLDFSFNRQTWKGFGE